MRGLCCRPPYKTLCLLDEDKAKDAVTADAKELDALMARPDVTKLFKMLLVLTKAE